MASERDSFVFYRSFWTSLSELDKEEQFLFFKSICEYVFCGVVPEWKSGLERAFWNDFKDRLDRDANRWEQTKIARSEAGKKGGAPKGNRNARKKNDDVEQGDFEKIPIGFVVRKWNEIYDDETKDNEGNFFGSLSTMHKISDFSEPISLDAQEQLDILNGKICNYIKNHDIKEIHKRAFGIGLPEEFDVNNKVHIRNMCWGVIVYSMCRLPDLRIKPKSSNFGTIQWFLKFENVLKLFNGEIS